uniref:Uncharacterized protein n=1 Tax=Vannella robusta TaxID=1487602 RepID=A0A7S4IQ30_9EUKA
MLRCDVSITTTWGAHGKPVEFHIKNGELEATEAVIHFPIPMKNAWDNVTYTCSTMLVFENESCVHSWSEQHRIPIGDIQPMEKIWKFSQEWYGSHLQPDWVKWTISQAKAMFSKYGLTHPIWNLETENEHVETF